MFQWFRVPDLKSGGPRLKTHPRVMRRNLKLEILSLNVFSEEFLLSSLSMYELQAY